MGNAVSRVGEEGLTSAGESVEAGLKSAGKSAGEGLTSAGKSVGLGVETGFKSAGKSVGEGLQSAGNNIGVNVNDGLMKLGLCLGISLGIFILLSTIIQHSQHGSRSRYSTNNVHHKDKSSSTDEKDYHENNYELNKDEPRFSNSQQE